MWLWGNRSSRPASVVHVPPRAGAPRKPGESGKKVDATAKPAAAPANVKLSPERALVPINRFPLVPRSTEADVIRVFEDAPVGRVITGDDGKLPLPPERRELMVGIDTGDGNCLLLVAPSAWGQAPHLDTRMLLRNRAGYPEVSARQATPDVIGHIYERQKPQAEWKLGSGVPDDSTIVERTIHEIVQEAYDMRASDIHLETRSDRADVLFRINGNRQFVRNMTKETATSFVQALYSHADPGSKNGSWNCDIPKDAAVYWKVKSRDGGEAEVQLRFASCPRYPAGNFFLVIRVLAMEASAVTIRTLGLLPEQQEMVGTFIGGSGGLVAIAGPMNSGKSTTMQAILKEVRSVRGDRISIQTVEDPVEYLIPGAIQMPVASAKDIEGRDLYNEAVKSKLRQDGDVLMIGEIRDGSTAKTVTTLVLCGRKLLTTIHSYSAFGTFLRLREMGVPWDILTTPGFLHGIIYQRLVPTLCPHCSVPIAEAGDRIRPSVLNRLMAATDLDGFNVRVRGDGCPACNGSGINGRTVVAEFIVPDRKLLQLLADGKFAEAEQYWHTSGVLRVSNLGVTVLAHAIQKMREGIVDPQDVENEVKLLNGDEAMRDARAAGADASEAARLDPSGDPTGDLGVPLRIVRRM